MPQATFSLLLSVCFTSNIQGDKKKLEPKFYAIKPLKTVRFWQTFFLFKIWTFHDNMSNFETKVFIERLFMSFQKNGLKISPYAASLSSNPLGIRKIETQSSSDAIRNFRLTWFVLNMFRQRWTDKFRIEEWISTVFNHILGLKNGQNLKKTCFFA